MGNVEAEIERTALQEDETYELVVKGHLKLNRREKLALRWEEESRAMNSNQGSQRSTVGKQSQDRRRQHGQLERHGMRSYSIVANDSDGVVSRRSRGCGRY